MMDLLKKYRVILIIVLPVLILVLVRSTGISHFKSDSKKWAQPTLVHSNTINSDQISKLGGQCMVICLDKAVVPAGITGDIQNVASDSILSRKFVKNILKHDGPVLLYSAEPALSARFWMLLSQLGCRNIYILTSNSDNEILKYKFQPDSTTVGASK
jgi:hypothetical protein